MARRSPCAAWIPLAAFALAPAFAADAPGAGIGTDTNLSFKVVPSVSVQETITDNYRLSSTNKQANAVTEASVGINVSSGAGRIKGFLDYSLTARLSSHDSETNGLRHLLRLSTLGSIELVDDRVFVDVRASIAPQAISAFGKQSFSSSVDNSNRTDVLNYGISPYARGRLGQLGNYEVRLDHSGVVSGDSNASDSSTTTASGTLSGGNPSGLFGWSVTASHQVSDFSDGDQTEIDRVRAVLTRAFGPHVSLSVIGGRESNNFQGIDNTSYTNSGLQVRWVPSERMSMSALYERRFFGNSHAVNFAYRTARTVWSFNDSQDISTTPDRVTQVILGNSYSVFFAQFAAIEPDPVRRDALVRAFLAVNGINPNALVSAGFLGSGATVARNQSFSVGLVGIRTNLTFRTNYSNSVRVSRLTIGSGNLTDSTRVRQRGLSVDLSHRLTPSASAGLTLQSLRITGAFDSLASTLSSLTASWSDRVNSRTSISAGARYVKFDSSTQPYTEKAVFATVRLTF